MESQVIKPNYVNVTLDCVLLVYHYFRIANKILIGLLVFTNIN